MSSKLHLYLGPYVEHNNTHIKHANTFDVGDEIKEALHAIQTRKGHFVWMPNVRRPNEPNFGDLDREGAIDLTSIQPQTAIAWFQKAFASELDVLSKHYGTLTFRFGLVRWWM